MLWRPIVSKMQIVNCNGPVGRIKSPTLSVIMGGHAGQDEDSMFIKQSEDDGDPSL